MSSKKILSNLSTLASVLIITVLVMAPLQITFAEVVEAPPEESAALDMTGEESTSVSPEAGPVGSPEPEDVVTEDVESTGSSGTNSDSDVLTSFGTEESIVEEKSDETQMGDLGSSDSVATFGTDVSHEAETGPEVGNVVIPENNSTGTATGNTGDEDEGVYDPRALTESTDATLTNEQENVPSQNAESLLMTSSATGSAATSSASVEEFQSSATSSVPTSSTTENTLEAISSDTVSATGTPTIVTGDSIALANVLNLVNTNFINSEGVIVFDNFFETLFGDFDLRDIYNSFAEFGCSLISCSQNDVTTNISNDAMIKNTLVIEALTGRNTIEGGATSTIDTGDAYAGLNLINVANTNVIDSNYLLVTMNAFKDVEGDIVFPSLSNFFNRVAEGVSPDALTISNSANVVNNVAISAETGSNGAEGNFGSQISTGGSTASTNVFNQLNTSLMGGQSISIIFRVHGSWAGEIFGAPSDLAWTEDGQGGIYLFDTASAFGSGGDLNINATNSASIQNDVSVVALTGENAITGAETALISTGNAYAGANIVNVANATVVGRNWILAIVNILGDFTGNISFGRPDLWVGAQVEVPNKIQNDSLLTYKLTVINNGDAPASNVRLTDDYDESFIDITSASVPYSVDGAGKVFWDIGELQPGMATEIMYSARIKNTTYSTDITNMLSVIERESDNNRLDNSDTITVTTDGRPQRNGDGIRISLGQTNKSSSDADAVRALQIDRLTASTTLIGVSRETVQELVLTNTSNNTIRSVVLHDVLVDPAGAAIKDEVWELGDVLPHEEVTITYKVTFSPNAPEGRYLLSTSVEGGGAKPLHENENGHITLVRTESEEDPSVTWLTPTVPEVLGISVTRTGSEQEEVSPSTLLPFAIPTAQAATRIDHGLPMTNIPYRYSLYFFILAIVLSNIYYMVRKANNMESDE